MAKLRRDQIWLLWGLHNDGQLALLGVFTELARPNAIRDYLRESDETTLVRVWVEKNLTNHMFGGTSGAYIPKKLWDQVYAETFGEESYGPKDAGAGG